MSLTSKAQQLIRSHFSSQPWAKNVAVDATCGNGNDTRFLSDMEFATIYAFDVQAEALKATREQVSSSTSAELIFFQQGHENLSKLVNQKIDCAMFNLGYLPGASKHITTRAETSVEALGQTLSTLSKTGIITILCYPGHPQGLEEAEAVNLWLQEIEQEWTVQKILSVGANESTPFLLSIRHHSAGQFDAD